MDNSTTWVYDNKEITTVRDAGVCPCGAKDQLGALGRFHSFNWCGNCHRAFALKDGTEVSPETILKTDRDGIVTYSPEFYPALGLLIEMSGVDDYIEMSPTKYGDVVLFALEGHFVGYLIYDRLGEPVLRALGIAYGDRGQGHGSHFVEQWFKTVEEEELSVMAFEETRGFYEQLDIPTNV